MKEPVTGPGPKTTLPVLPVIPKFVAGSIDPSFLGGVGTKDTNVPVDSSSMWRDPTDYKEGVDNRRREADNQGWGEQLAKATARIPLTALSQMVQGFGYLGTLGTNLAKDNADYSNTLAKFGDDMATWNDELGLTLHKKDQNAVFDFTDTASYFGAGESVVGSVLGFMIPGMAVAKGTAMLAEFLAASKVGAVLEGIAGAGRAARILNGGANLITASSMAYSESAMSAAQIYKEGYDRTYAKLRASGMSEEESISQAKQVAAEGAATVAQVGTLLGTVTGMSTFAPFFAKNKNLSDFFNSAGVAREAGEDALTYAQRIRKISSDAVRTYTKNGSVTRMATEAGLEGVEEVGTQFAEYMGRDSVVNGRKDNTIANKIRSLLDLADNSTATNDSRISAEGKFNWSEAGLNFALGAIGGSGQAIMTNYAPVNRQRNADGSISWVSNYTQGNRDQTGMFTSVVDSLATTAQHIHDIQQELKAEATKPVPNEARLNELRQKLTNGKIVENLNINLGENTAKNFLRDFESIASTDNTKDTSFTPDMEARLPILDEIIANPEKLQDDATLGSAAQQFADAKKERADLLIAKTKAETNPVTAAMAAGLATSPEDNDYKADVQAMIADIKRLSDMSQSLEERYHLSDDEKSAGLGLELFKLEVEQASAVRAINQTERAINRLKEVERNLSQFDTNIDEIKRKTDILRNLHTVDKLSKLIQEMSTPEGRKKNGIQTEEEATSVIHNTTLRIGALQEKLATHDTTEVNQIRTNVDAELSRRNVAASIAMQESHLDFLKHRTSFYGNFIDSLSSLQGRTNYMTGTNKRMSDHLNGLQKEEKKRMEATNDYIKRIEEERNARNLATESESNEATKQLSLLYKQRAGILSKLQKSLNTSLLNFTLTGALYKTKNIHDWLYKLDENTRQINKAMGQFTRVFSDELQIDQTTSADLLDKTNELENKLREIRTILPKTRDGNFMYNSAVDAIFNGGKFVPVSGFNYLHKTVNEARELYRTTQETVSELIEDPELTKVEEQKNEEIEQVEAEIIVAQEELATALEATANVEEPPVDGITDDGKVLSTSEVEAVPVEVLPDLEAMLESVAVLEKRSAELRDIPTEEIVMAIESVDYGAVEDYEPRYGGAGNLGFYLYDDAIQDGREPQIPIARNETESYPTMDEYGNITAYLNKVEADGSPQLNKSTGRDYKYFMTNPVQAGETVRLRIDKSLPSNKSEPERTLPVVLEILRDGKYRQVGTLPVYPDDGSMISEKMLAIRKGLIENRDKEHFMRINTISNGSVSLNDKYEASQDTTERSKLGYRNTDFVLGNDTDNLRVGIVKDGTITDGNGSTIDAANVALGSSKLFSINGRPVSSATLLMIPTRGNATHYPVTHKGVMLKNRTIKENTGDSLAKILVAAYAMYMEKVRGSNDSTKTILSASKDILNVMVELGYDVDETNPEIMYGNLMALLTQHFGPISTFKDKDLLQETTSNPYKLSVRYDQHGLIVKIGKHARNGEAAKIEYMLTYEKGKSKYNPAFEAMLKEYTDNVFTMPQVGGLRVVGFTNSGEAIQRELRGINDENPYNSIQVDSKGVVYTKKFDNYNQSVFARTTTHLAPAKVNGKNFYFLNPVMAMDTEVTMQAIPEQVADDELVVVEKVRKAKKRTKLDVPVVEKAEESPTPTKIIETVDENTEKVTTVPAVEPVPEVKVGPKKLELDDFDTGDLMFAMESSPTPKLKKEVGGKEFTRTPCNPM